jgi:hypothetical protein
MAINVVQETPLLTAGLQATFANTYAKSYRSSVEKVSRVVQLGLPATARTVPLGYNETAPYPQFWDYGEEIPEGNFNSVGYSVTIRRWAHRVKWNHDDRIDEQTNTLKQRVLQLAEHYGTLHERIAFQLIRGNADPKLLPAVPNAPDGAAFFATTAGGVNRFGVSSGNLLTGNGVNDVASIQRDYYRALQQWLLQTDPQGEPLHQPEEVEGGILVIAGASVKENFERAFYGTIQQGVAAGLSNILKDAGKNFDLWFTPRIPDNDWFLFLTGSELKPIGQFTMEDLMTTEADWSNSDFARTNDIEYFQAKARYGYVINLPYQAMEINN